MAKLSKCLTCGDQPLLRANCLACSGTGKRSPSPTKKAPAPRRVTPAASVDFDGFNPAEFDSDYQAGGRSIGSSATHISLVDFNESSDPTGRNPTIANFDYHSIFEYLSLCLFSSGVCGLLVCGRSRSCRR